MLLKYGVLTGGVQPQAWYAIGRLEECYAGHGAQLVVTSLVDGTHMAGSLHYKGLAIDVRTRGIAPDTLALIHQEVVAKLRPIGYDVVMEGDHLHIEYDFAHNRLSWFQEVS